MATKKQTISALPPPPIPPQLNTLSTPKIYKISLSPSSLLFPTDEKQKQTNNYIQSNINNNKHKNDNGHINIDPPSPTFSGSLNSIDDDLDNLYDINEEKKENISIWDTYGLNTEINTNNLSWSNIINKYEFNETEILGSKKLQFKLCKLYNISIDINKYFPPFECIRYYCGCSKDLERAIIKWKYSIRMFKEYNMNIINDIEIFECFKTLSKSIAFGGYDCDGCRIITIKYSLFYFNEYKNINIFLLAGFYLFYYLTHDVKAHRNGVTLLCDLNGFSLSNFSFTVEKNGIHFAQKVLPIRIKKIFVIDAPWIAHYALKLVLPLLNEKLRKRVFIVTNDELYDDNIKKIINKNDLPVLVGGNFDKKYLNDNNKSFLYHVLAHYFNKTVNLNHFNVECINQE